MAKIVRRKRKLKLQNLLTLLLLVSLVLYFSSITFIKSYNISLNKNYQTIKMQNEEEQKELEILRLDVAKYTEREYLMSVCAQYGYDLSFDSDRIEYITAGSEE